MARKPVGFIHPDTGEVEQCLMLVRGRQRITAGKFLMMFQDALVMLATDNDLTPQAQRVFIYLLGKLDFDNWIHIKQKEIGEALNISAGNLSRAMSILKRKEIILVAPYQGVRCYRLNNWVGWKGSVVNFNKEVRDRKLKLVKSDNPKSPPT